MIFEKVEIYTFTQTLPLCLPLTHLSEEEDIDNEHKQVSEHNYSSRNSEVKQLALRVHLYRDDFMRKTFLFRSDHVFEGHI